MVHLVLTGATGLVGSSVLAHILSLPPSTTISRLSILSRSPVPLASKKDRTNTTTQIEVINHTDYNNYPPEVLAKLKGATGVIWAQGISQTEVDGPTYVKITKDYPLSAAKAFSALNDDKINFVYVSGEGATYNPGRFTQTFARVKGEAELALVDLSKQEPFSKTLRIYNARPGGVDGTSQPEIWDQIVARRSFLWRCSMKIMIPPLNVLSKNLMIPTPELGKVLTELAMSDGKPLEGKGIEGEGRLVRNIGVRRMGGLPV
jgi:hypothetical protein